MMTHIMCCRSVVTVHVIGQMSAVVAATTVGGHSITSMTFASPAAVTCLHAWSSRMQTPSLHGHMRVPWRVRRKPSRALCHRRSDSCGDTQIGQLQKFTVALRMHLRVQEEEERKRTHTHAHTHQEWCERCRARITARPCTSPPQATLLTHSPTHS